MYSLRSLVTHFSVKLNISLSTSHYCFCFVIVPPVHITYSKSVYSRIKIMWPEVFQVEVTRLLFTCKRLHGLLFSQQQGGTTGKENEVKKRQQKGRAQDSPSGIRASLDCSAPAWVQPTLSSAASGFRNSVHIWRSSTGMQQQDLGVWAPLDCFLPFWSCDFGRRDCDSRLCGQNTARKSRAGGYATGGKVGSGRLQSGARRRDPQVR